MPTRMVARGRGMPPEQRGQQGPPHPVLGIRNFFVFFSYFGNAGPREMGVGSSVGDFTARAGQDRGWGGQNAKHSSGTAQLPVYKWGGGLVARWLASPHIRRLPKVDGFMWAPRTGSGDDVADQVDGFDGGPCLGPAWAPSRWIWWWALPVHAESRRLLGPARARCARQQRGW